jgi:hypothetical protein
MSQPSLVSRIATSTRGAGRRGFLLGSASAALGLSRAGQAIRAQETEGRLVPEAAPGQNAFEFVLTAHQLGFEFSFYGYVTRVAGIEPSLLFTNADPTNRGPADARLTMFGTVAASSRSILQPVFNVNGEGTLNFYLSHAGGADFATPAAFQAGTLVASGSARIQSVVTVIAPQTGLTHGYGDITIDTSEPFAIGDARFVFSAGGPSMRLTYNGYGTLLDPDLPESMLYIVGNGASVG